MKAFFKVAAEAARQKRRKKRRTRAGDSFCNGTFADLYDITDELLGEGAYATVWTCVNKYTYKECAVKVSFQINYFLFLSFILIILCWSR